VIQAATAIATVACAVVCSAEVIVVEGKTKRLLIRAQKIRALAGNCDLFSISCKRKTGSTSLKDLLFTLLWVATSLPTFFSLGQTCSG
jgi:hypothetical protein